MPSIGFISSKLAHALEGLLELVELRRALDARRRSRSASSSSRPGRNSCSGGSSSRIVTGRPVHRLEQALEVAALERQQLRERGAPVLLGVGHDHRPHLRLAVLGHEHVLGAAQADALGTELARLAGILRGVGVRAHAERADLVAQSSTVSKFGDHSGSTSGTSSVVTMPLRAVDRDQVALAQHGAVHAQLVRPSRSMSRPRGARHARPSHAARHQRRVRGLAALGGEDPARRVEAGHVVGLGERPHQDHVAPALRRRHGLRRR